MVTSSACASHAVTVMSDQASATASSCSPTRCFGCRRCSSLPPRRPLARCRSDPRSTSTAPRRGCWSSRSVRSTPPGWVTTTVTSPSRSSGASTSPSKRPSICSRNRRLVPLVLAATGHITVPMRGAAHKMIRPVFDERSGTVEGDASGGSLAEVERARRVHAGENSGEDCSLVRHRVRLTPTVSGHQQAWSRSPSYSPTSRPTASMPGRSSTGPDGAPA